MLLSPTCRRRAVHELVEGVRAVLHVGQAQRRPRRVGGHRRVRLPRPRHGARAAPAVGSLYISFTPLHFFTPCYMSLAPFYTFYIFLHNPITHRRAREFDSAFYVRALFGGLWDLAARSENAKQLQKWKTFQWINEKTSPGCFHWSARHFHVFPPVCNGFHPFPVIFTNPHL